MKSGLLWFDDDPKTGLTNKILRVCNFYKGKYRKNPNLCQVNLINNQEKIEFLEGITVQSVPNMLPNHFWIGVEDEF